MYNRFVFHVKNKIPDGVIKRTDRHVCNPRKLDDHEVRSKMKNLLMSLATVIFMGSVAAASIPDLGAQIIDDNAKLGARVGEIHVTASGTISEGEVYLSVGHDLVCDTDQITISLNAGSYLYQNSHTRIKNCIISSTSIPILGEIQSANADHVVLDHVTFVGGGNLVYWTGVRHFSILNNTVLSITAVDPSTDLLQSGFYLLNCSHGQVNNLRASHFVFPAGSNSSGILSLNLSSYIAVNNAVINDVDASYVRFGGGGIVIAGSTHITVNGGAITHNSNMDGILSELYEQTPSYNVTITGVNSSYNGGKGRNPQPYLTNVLGDGIDLINTGHVYISHCILRGAGYLLDQQAGIWIFIDDDVVVADSDISDGSAAGIQIAGSPNVRFIRDSINRNQGSGVYVEWQAGTATNVGSIVTFVGGVSGGFGGAWAAGTPFILDGVTYEIASVTDSGHLILANTPANHSSPVSWGVNSTLEISGGVIDDNGLGRFGGQNQEGISLADGTTARIFGVTVTDTGAGSQLFALELENTASAFLSSDNFSGNVEGGNGISAKSQVVSPTSLSFPNQRASTTSSEQPLTLTAGAVAVHNLHVQARGDFGETNACSTDLPPFGTCEIRVTFIPTAAGTRNGSISITDSAPRSPQTVSLAGAGVSPLLGLGIASGTSSAATVAPGATAKYTLSIGGARVSGTASLSCIGTPKDATCNVAATQVVSAATATDFTVRVTTTPRTLGALRRSDFRPWTWFWAIFMMGWVVQPIVSKNRSARRYLALLLLLLMFLCFCGGRSKSGSGTPAGTYTLTVTAKVGSTSEPIPLTLTVQ